MQKKYKIIDSIIISFVILIVLSLSIYSYVSVINLIDEIKLNLSNKISLLLNKRISIGTISPLFFNGIKIRDFYIYEDVLNDKIAYIETVRIRIKIMDILTGKVTIDKSISSIKIEDFIFNLNEKHIKEYKSFNFVNTGSTNGSVDTEKFTLDFILEEGIVNITYNNKRNRLHIMNNYSKIDLEDNRFDVDLKMEIEKFNDMKLQNSFFLVQLDGIYTGKSITCEGDIRDITLGGKNINNYFQFDLNASQDLKRMDLSVTDKYNSLTLKMKKNNSNHEVTAFFEDFPLSDYAINGDLKYKKTGKKSNYRVSLHSDPKEKLFVNIDGNHEKIEIKDFKVYFKKNRFIYANGFYNVSKNYFLKVWLNNIQYNDFKFHGKTLLFNDQYNNHKIKLLDFKINEFLIREYEGIFELVNNSVKLRTLYSSENFSLKLDKKLNSGLYDINLEFREFGSYGLYKLFKLNYQEDARISGDLNLKLNKSFFNVNNRLEIDFKNNKEIKKVYLNSTVMKDHLNINYKVVLKNNKLVIIRGRSINNNSISGIIDYDKIERKFVLNYKEDRNKYFFQLLFDKMDLQVKYFNNYDFSAILKVNRIIDEDFKTRLIVNAFAKGNFKKIKNIYLKGDMKIRNLLQSGSSTFSFKKVKNKIRFNDIQIKLDRNLWTGAGYYNLNDQKVNIAMNKMNIKGAYKKGVFNLYVFFKKNKNFYYQSAIFNVNGFLNIKYSLNLFRTYGDMNIYNFKYKELKIPETYAVFIYQNNNFSFKKLNFDYNKGKIYCNIKSLYKENNMYCGEAVLVARNVDFDANKISTKLYSKFCLGDAIDLKLKILYLAFNDLEIDDIDEEIYFHKNKMKITKINNNGITGYINFFKNRMDLDLALDLENSHIKFYGKKVEKKINYNFILDNFNLEFFEEALPLIKKAEGRISSKLSFTGSSDNPLVNGSITGHNLYLKFYDMIKKVTDLDLGVNINNNLIRIMQCKGFIGKGEFSLLGDVLLEKLKIVNLDLVLKTLGKRGLFIERSKNDLIGEVITDLQIKGNPEKIGIGGTLTANNFDFTWPLSENDKKDNDFFKDTVIDFNIDIIAGKNVRFFQDVNGMDILVKEGGKYHLRGDLSRKHKVVGRMEAEKGTMDYFGTTFNIIHANVDFSSHYHENVPWISAKAEAESKLGEENYIITMVVDGRAYNNLTPQLTSTPSLTQREIFLLFNDSTLYVSDRVQDEVEEEKEINRLIKTGFIQIFYSTYRSKLVTPIERKARRFLGLDLLKIKTSLVEKLLEPKLYKVEDHEDKSVNPLVDTQLSVGKYVTENLLLKYSVILKEEIDFANLYYEQKVGFEWRIFSSLNFEYLYFPLYYDDYSQPLSEQKYKLEWKQKISF